jgi:CTD small phosphatase-like protein 2
VISLLESWSREEPPTSAAAADQSSDSAEPSPEAQASPGHPHPPVAMEVASILPQSAVSFPSSLPPPPLNSYNLDPFLLIARLPPIPAQYLSRAPLLPPAVIGGKPMLVLDLDETLVHCSTEPLLNPHHTFTVCFNQWNYKVYVKKRPHVEAFLEHVAKAFEITVFTASQQVYADTLLNLIDPEHRWIRHRLFREHCVFVEGNYLKDLSVLGRDLAQVIIVDNSPQAFGYQLDNGIPIETWIDDTRDTELLNLIPLLDHLITVSDVRPVLRQYFRLHEIVLGLSLNF